MGPSLRATGVGWGVGFFGRPLALVAFCFDGYFFPSTPLTLVGFSQV